MGFWNFLRDMFVFDWGVGEYRKRKSTSNQTRHSDYNNYTGYNSDCEHDHYHESCEYDHYHDSSDDYAHDFDDFEDDF